MVRLLCICLMGMALGPLVANALERFGVGDAGQIVGVVLVCGMFGFVTSALWPLKLKARG